ncbi:MAG: hypothetical protein JNJ61_26095 [Anaerolineae bacterium]|nr:hypothetical protein [Anaerolineae bacterium]
MAAGEELLRSYGDIDVLGDKAYIDADPADELRQQRGIHLFTLTRRNQRPDAFRHPFNNARRLIETVNSQLTEQFASKSITPIAFPVCVPA